MQRNPESARAVLRQFAQTGAITESEVLHDFDDISNRHLSDFIRLPNYLRYALVASNEPFRILMMLLTGMHSANFRTDKGSIYRIRFVAPGEPNSASTPATKAPAAAAAAAAAASKTSKMVTKSAAYPLVLVGNDYFPDKWSDSWNSSKQTKEKLDEEFRQLIKEEMRAVDALDTSDSSSMTDTNWVYARKARTFEGTNVEYKFPNSHYYSHADGALQPNVDNKYPWVHDPNYSGISGKSHTMYLQQNVTEHFPEF